MNFVRGVRLNRSKEQNTYPFNIPAVRHLYTAECLSFCKPITFFVGENGTGKSTLIEAIAVALGYNPEGGTKNHVFHTKHTHSKLSDYLTIIKSTVPDNGFFLRAESFYNMASYLEEVGFGSSLHKQSHGESFLAVARNRFKSNGLYILDEPEAALSPQGLMSLLVIMDELVKSNCQFIIATHSPILMAYPNADILQFGDYGIKKVGYKETDHYLITKQFLEGPERMMAHLLSDRA